MREEEGEQRLEPVEWFVMTNEPVASIEAAYEKVMWYMQRWKIEQFHYVLKSGCKVEKLQERQYGKNHRISFDVFDNSGNYYEHNLCGENTSRFTLYDNLCR